MRDDPALFTPDDKMFLTLIRDDIAARPDFYRAGIDHIARRFSIEALHAADVKTWAEERDLPVRIAANREIAAHSAWLTTWPDDEPDERDRVEREMHGRAASMPNTGRWSYLSNRLTEAFLHLLREGIETADDDLDPYNLERVKAILCLTWLLTDKDADTHPLGATFGPWLAGQRGYVKLPPDEEFRLEIKAGGRALARTATLDASDPELRTRWITLAKSAWNVVQREQMSKHPSMTVGAAEAPGGRFYVFCRIWPGFTDRFPVATFNHLPDEKIVGAVQRAIEHEFRTHPDLAAKWREALEDEAKARWAAHMQHYRPVTYGGASVTGPRHPKHGELMHPEPQLEPIPSITTAPGMQYALWVLGWRGLPDDEWRVASTARKPPLPPLITPASHPYQTRHVIVSAEVEQDAADAVMVLNRQYGNMPSATRFGYFGGDTMDRAGRLICDQQVDQMREAVDARSDSTSARNPLGRIQTASAPSSNYQPARAELMHYARCGLDLLVRMTPARGGQNHPDRRAPVPVAEPPKVLVGKEGRQKHVEERYKQLARECDSAGNPVYPSQEKIIKKLIEEDVASRNTILSDIKSLRNQKRLPPLSRGNPRELTNRMHRINPTRRDDK